jgi:hypothetical protein
MPPQEPTTNLHPEPYESNQHHNILDMTWGYYSGGFEDLCFMLASSLT